MKSLTYNQLITITGGSLISKITYFVEQIRFIKYVIWEYLDYKKRH